MRRAVWSLFFAAFVAVSAFPDTVTNKDHLSVNGSLTQMSDGVITLEAEFASDSKTPIIRTLHISIREVESIEFNDTTFNPGAPQKSLGITPPPANPKQTPGAVDQVVLRGGILKDCKLVGIDQESIHCAGKGADYMRKIILRIQVRAH
jgi:hypothetical protein